MTKTIIFLLIFGCGVIMSARETNGQKIVTAAQVNGTWREVTSNPRGVTTEFWFYSLGNGKMQIEFVGSNVAGKVGNAALGEVKIEGTTATFKPEDYPCELSLKFTGAKLSVEQNGDCGWARGIDAAGTYKKISSKKPKFYKE